MKDIKSLTQEELQQFMQDIGEKKFRGSQIFEWLHKKKAADFDEMSNLSKTLREQLAQTAQITVLQQEAVQAAKDGTRKYLFGLWDGNMVESVLMRYHYGNSVCISSQVGCRMGCAFCASTLDGLVRNLTPAEMLDQVYRIGQDIGERISHVVVMGMGEPLDNYDSLLKFIRILNSADGADISQRNVTVSTCGLVPQMYRLADEKLQITLALSLHAPDQEKRERLMPVAQAYPLSEVIEACRYYFAQTGRRISFEYSLMAGENDLPDDARSLAALVKGMNCHINLIPVNPVKERAFCQPHRVEVLNFKNNLEKYGINVTIRREMGREIDGACGQLRKSYAGSGACSAKMNGDLA